MTHESHSFPWVFVDGKSSSGEDYFQFCHVFFEQWFCTDTFTVILPIIKKLQSIAGVAALCRIKANLVTRTPKIVEFSMHIDMGDLDHDFERLGQWTTAIFYVNTNNGYTKFENGEMVGSVANRMVIFPANIPHTGTSCTDEKRRVVINFNYYKRFME